MRRGKSNGNTLRTHFKGKIRSAPDRVFSAQGWVKQVGRSSGGKGRAGAHLHSGCVSEGCHSAPRTQAQSPKCSGRQPLLCTHSRTSRKSVNKPEFQGPAGVSPTALLLPAPVCVYICVYKYIYVYIFTSLHLLSHIRTHLTKEKIITSSLDGVYATLIHFYPAILCRFSCGIYLPHSQSWSS